MGPLQADNIYHAECRWSKVAVREEEPKSILKIRKHPQAADRKTQHLFHLNHGLSFLPSNSEHKSKNHYYYSTVGFWRQFRDKIKHGKQNHWSCPYFRIMGKLENSRLML